MRRALVLGLVLLTPGCTFLNVERVPPGTDSALTEDIPSRFSLRRLALWNEHPPLGVRYSLPKPVLRVTPKPDGTLSVDVDYIPDPDMTFAIDGWSLFATHSLQTDIAGGLLKAVTWTADDSAVLAEATKSAGEVVKQSLEAQAAKESAVRTAQQEALESAQAAVAAAQVELLLAEAELDVLQAPGSGASEAQVLAAKVKVAVAQTKLNAAFDTQAELRQTTASMNAAMSARKTGGAWGPVFYHIDDTMELNTSTNRLENVVALRPADAPGSGRGNKQGRYRTSRPPARQDKKPTLSHAEPIEIPVGLKTARLRRDRALETLAAVTSMTNPPPDALARATVEKRLAEWDVARFRSNRNLYSFSIHSDKPLLKSSLNVSSFTTVAGASATKPALILDEALDSRRVRVELPSGLSAGTYKLEFDYRFHFGGTPDRGNKVVVFELLSNVP